MLWGLKLRSLFNRNLQSDVDDELRSHLEMKAEELEAGGLAADEAWREARRRFGNLTKAQENTREMHVFTLLEALIQDLRYGLRRLRREPAFTCAAILTLGLVIGANGTIFSVLEAILLRPLPFAEPSRLVVLYGTSRQSVRERISMPDLQEFQKAQSLTGLAAEETQSVNLTGVDEPGRLIGSFVSGGYFPLLGVQPAQGRTFTAEEERPGGAAVCILTDSVWRNRFGADPKILGRSLTLNAAPFTVVGILPAGYRPTFTNAEVWVPLHHYPNYSLDRGNRVAAAVARLADGVTLERTRVELTTLAEGLARQFPETNRNQGIAVQPARAVAEGDSRGTLLVLMGAASCVLLLGCANLAGLLLTKAAGRKHEMAIRASVGASRGRLMRQLITECLVLSVLGGLLGIGLAYGGMQLLIAYCGELVSTVNLEINTTVLLYLLGVSIASGLLFGLAPALLARRESANTLRQHGAGSARGGLRSLLVVAQVAVALVLLIGSGLMVKSLYNVASIEPGFRGEHVLTMEYRIPRGQYPSGGEQTRFHHEVIARVAALPGVESAALTGGVPFSGNEETAKITLPDRPAPLPEAPLVVLTNAATPFYFKTLGIPLLGGRDFRLDDGPGSALVAIVNQAFVTRFWPGGNAVGKQVTFPGNPAKTVTIVGVVGNTKQESLDDVSLAQIFRPYAQTPFVFAALAVKTRGEPLAMTRAVQRAIWSIDKNQPMWKIRTLQSLVDRSFSIRRYTVYLLVSFAFLALVLAAIGLYGVLAYAVSQRTAEFGVRMALGASSGDILGMVLRRGLWLTLSGLAAGVAVSLVISRLLTAYMFAMSVTDPMVYAALCLLLLLVAMVAVFLPARRAMLVDPVTAIRQE